MARIKEYDRGSGRKPGYLENCDAVIRQLRKKGRLPEYTKSDDLYGALLPKQPDAVRRAEKRMQEVSKVCFRRLSGDREPSPVSFCLSLTDQNGFPLEGKTIFQNLLRGNAAGNQLRLILLLFNLI